MNIIDCFLLFFIVFKFYKRSHPNVPTPLDVLQEEPPQKYYLLLGKRITGPAGPAKKIEKHYKKSKHITKKIEKHYQKTEKPKQKRIYAKIKRISR